VHELARERDLVAVVAQRLGALDRSVRGSLAGGLVERAALEELLGVARAPGHRGDPAQDDARIAGDAADALAGHRDRDLGEAPGLPFHRLLERAATGERVLRHADLDDQLARTDGVLPAVLPLRRAVQVGERDGPPPARALEQHRRVVGDERRGEVRGSDGDALLRAEDRVAPAVPVHGEAADAALQPAGVGLVAEVRAAVALQEVPADGPHRAQLHGRRGAQGLGHDGQERGELRRGLELDERYERADAQPAALRARPPVQRLDAADVHDPLRRGDPGLHQAEEVGPAGEHGRATPGERERLAERGGLGVGERPHRRSSSASSSRWRVIGAVRTRTPVAFATAFAIAAGSGMIGGSPSPFAPMLFAFVSGSSAKRTVIFGMSRTVGTL
jgi:hypothetical protein